MCHDRAMSSDPSTYRELAERAWAWVLTQVRQGDEGIWLTESPGQTEPGEYGMHSGVGGLAHVLEEIRLTRPLGAAEHALGEGIGETVVRRIPDETGYDYFDGLTSTIGILTALDAPGVELAVARLQGARHSRRVAGTLDRAAQGEPRCTLQRRDPGHRGGPARRPLGPAARRGRRG